MNAPPQNPTQSVRLERHPQLKRLRIIDLTTGQTVHEYAASTPLDARVEITGDLSP